MRTIHPYLNFNGQAEEAFNFYKSILGGEFLMFQRMGDMPDADIPENEKNLVMHVALPINEHTILMASDCSSAMKVNAGNNLYININAESREDADYLFNGLSAGGTIEMPMEDMFWGDYFGSFKDKFGVMWMINFGVYK